MASMTEPTERLERWRQEAAFFDRAAQRSGGDDLLLDPLAVERYSRRRLRERFSIELRFRLLAPLTGSRLLDVGCGEGLNSVLFAKLGAEVTGIDISSGAIEVARRRAAVNGVADRTRFVCAPLEAAELPERGFDVVWGDGILHHVLPELPAVLARVHSWTRPEGLMVFSEPVNLSPWFRRVRSVVPMRTDVTPGERPLVRSEIDLVRRYVPDLQVRRFALLGRLDRFLLPGCNYEHASPFWRALSNAAGLLDRGLLSLPLVRDLAGTCVMYGHPKG